MPDSSRPRPSVRRAAVAAATVLALGAPAAVLTAGSADAATAHTTPATMATAVVKLLNKERAAHHLPSLTVDKHLVAAASRHSHAMAAKNQLSHQVRGEASLPTRVTRAGYTWRALAENLGYSRHTTTKGALHIIGVWYGEKPPNDPHRVNSLGSQWRNIGVAIVIDKKHHRLWLTADFGRH